MFICTSIKELFTSFSLLIEAEHRFWHATWAWINVKATYVQSSRNSVRINNIILITSSLAVFLAIKQVFRASAASVNIRDTLTFKNLKVFEVGQHRLFEKAIFFPQKFNFDKKFQHFHEFFTQKIDNFPGKLKLNFWTKNQDFEQCAAKYYANAWNFMSLLYLELN